MQDFTPFSGLLGGLLIGLAVATLLLLNGRIGGISGIVGGLLASRTPEVGWRAAFVVGIIAGAFLYMAATGDTDVVSVRATLPAVIVGGLLVGFGTRLGSGCTSGHGLCGLARFSRRSAVATAVFFGVAILTVFLTRHVL